MSVGEELLEERRRAGDQRITPKDRALLLRMTTHDLMDELQAAWPSWTKRTLTVRGESCPAGAHRPDARSTQSDSLAILEV